MKNYTITSYVGVGLVKFGMMRCDVHNILGAPPLSKKSRFCDEITDYWECNGLQLAFSGKDELLEISLYTNLPDVELCQIKLFEIPGINVLNKLHKLDNEAFEEIGIVVFPKLGIAVNGFSSDDDAKSVTVFTQGRWSEEIKKNKYKLKIGDI